MSAERLKLTTYFGERDPSGGGFLADALVDVYARHGVQVSALLRGIEGFGLAHALHTDRLLTASEDLPIVSVALDARERIEGLVAEVRRISGHGLITVEPAGDAASPGGDAKLMVFLGRKARAGGRPAYEAVTEILHACGAAGATVLLGVDGTFAGTRRRARFFGANADVPLVVVAVGTAGAVAAAVEQIARAVPGALTTVEDVRVCKRDGRRLAAPHAGSSGAEWQKLMVHTTDHDRLMARLRRAGGRGATALRGVWGFRGDHAPHGEAFWSLRRQVGVLVVIVDTPERIARAYAIVDELTAESGLVTSELVRRA